MQSPSTIALPHQISQQHDKTSSQATDAEATFLAFLTRDRSNRRLSLLVLLGTIAQFTIFKLLYPYPDFFSDSYSYLYAAYAHLDVSIWPIGYSKFLAAFHALTHSDTALVAFQYFFLEAAALYFYLTLNYLFHPGRAVRIILLLFLFVNPLFLYLSNYVNSDPLFAALSLFWFTGLIWIVCRPRGYQVLTQGALLFLCFAVRNNAYIYPLIGIIAFLLSQQRPWIRLAGSLAGPLLILPFILHTRTVAKEMTGTAQFSFFTGWQLANNALYMYGYIHPDSNLFTSPAAREMNRLSTGFYQHVRPDFDQFLVDYPANYFIQSPTAPLKIYMARHYKRTDLYGGVISWGRASADFEPFGATLIRHYPLAFFSHFLLPNARNFLLPDLEKLKLYNTGRTEVERIAQDWFDYKTTDISVVSQNFQGELLYLYPYSFLFINIYLLAALAWFVVQKKYAGSSSNVKGLLLLSTAFVLANACFCILTTVIVFRYEFFPMIVSVSFSLLLATWLEASPSASDTRPLLGQRTSSHKNVQVLS